MYAFFHRLLGKDKEYENKLNKDDFIVQVKENRTVINNNLPNNDTKVHINF